MWFQIDVGAVQWFVIAYLLPISGFVLAFGKLGNLYGHRRIFMLGMLVSLLAHTLSGLAPSYGSLLCLRVLQGLGFGLIFGQWAGLDDDPRRRRPSQSGAVDVHDGVWGGHGRMVAGPIMGGPVIDIWG